ncbi:MAG TPA: glycosyltransferase family 4 protein [Dongiaceae bacterium]|jgi:glycosyltransferase involved in cell wall biosynthesis|nr:glycosyltransferase family 4 protein [Dongiaceae bacterium]
MKNGAKTVLFVGAYPRSAAVERYVSGDLALRLEARGWKVGLTSRRTSRLGRLLDLLATIWRTRREYAVAAVDVFSGPAFIWAEASCALLRYLGKPYVLTLHGGGLPEFARQHPARVKKLLGSAPVVTCPSPYLMAEMQPYRENMILLPNGLELERYHFGERPQPLRQLMWLRAFHEVYHPQLAVQVLDAVRKAGRDDVRLVMIGPDKGDGTLQQAQALTAKLGLQAAVEFRGPVDKAAVPQQLAAGDVFLNTTNYDNTPVSVMEAMACGLPVVTTNVGGIPYLLQDGETALLVPPNDLPLMSQAVLRVLTKPDLAARLAQNGRRQVAAYDWQIILPRWEDLLERLLAEKK